MSNTHCQLRAITNTRCQLSAVFNTHCQLTAICDTHLSFTARGATIYHGTVYRGICGGSRYIIQCLRYADGTFRILPYSGFIVQFWFRNLEIDSKQKWMPLASMGILILRF